MLFVLGGCPEEVQPASPRPATQGPDAAAGTDGGDGSPTCPTGFQPCGGVCTDTQANREHCGGCDMPCGPEQLCNGGRCVCDGTLQACGDDCVDTSSDAQNCGDCGVTCGPTQVCAGSCIDGSCPSDTTNCNGSCVDTTSATMHCGGCNQPCGEGETCTGSTCTCREGFLMCDGRCLPEVTFAADVEPIFTNTCASATTCHAGGRPAAGLSLEPGQAVDNLVNVQATGCRFENRVRVVPGDPSRSYLLNKLLGVDMCTGKRMPLGSTPLSTTRLDAIRAWICQLDT